MTRVGTGWAHTEFRSYTFVSENDEDASVVETFKSRERRLGEEIPLTATEQMEFKRVAEKTQNNEEHTTPPKLSEIML